MESTYRTNGPAVKACFEPVREVLQASSAVIKSGRKEIAYGTVMSADGFIVTKASEIEDAADLSVIVAERTYKDPVVLGIDPAWDVALLKIQAEALVPVNLALDSPDPERGTWVVANGATSRTRRRPQVGIISATAREIAPAGGAVLGVTLEESDEQLRVSETHESSGAKEAGIEPGDIILAADGVEVTNRQALGEVIDKHRVGEMVHISLKRGDEKLELEVRLAGRVDLFGEEQSRNDQMSGRFSGRRSGFPRVIQHDIIANNAGMGGPLLDLDGRCLGMNIARANRCETFAIPAGDLQSLTDRLITQVTK
ncbi:S1C family serine protease [Luteolibacter marinus]|uniref:S1C family serine protease n=1 Tax=Luteolibacter marinus TaxID=2776705 RepID=UPI001865D504|nr:PDZ domain-containing protein [Luteolibacter marinus]